MAGFASTWLAPQQEHSVGHKALFHLLRGDLHRGEEWTDFWKRPGDLAMSPWQVLPPGEFTALLQIWSTQASRNAGRLIVENDGGQVLAELPVVTAPEEFGDWQRVLVAFRLDDSARVRIRFHYDGAVSIWTGAIHLTRSGRRPIYIIGHNRNTPEEVDKSLENGANAIEVDISYRDGKIMAAEVPPFPGWERISEASKWLRHAQACRDRWAFLYIDCKLHQVPDDNFYAYGQAIAKLFLDAGIDPKRCMFSIPDASGIDIHRAARASGFAGSSFAIDGIDKGQPAHTNPQDWPAAAEQYKLEVIGMGRAALAMLINPLEHWWPAVQATVASRDAGRLPRNVIFWSLTEKASMRKLLDLGVDGIIADEEANLVAVLDEEPYRQFCRRAVPNEWDPFHAFGVDP
jgi:hypothetical protein